MRRIDGSDEKHKIKAESIASPKKNVTTFLSNLQKTISCSDVYLQEKINLLPKNLQPKISPQLIIRCSQWMLENIDYLLERIDDGTFSMSRGARFSKELTGLGICIHVIVNSQGKLLMVLDPKGKNVGKAKDPEEDKPENKLKVIGHGIRKIAEYGLFVDGDQLLPAAVYVLKHHKAVEIIEEERIIGADIIQKNKGLLIPNVITEVFAGDEYFGHGKNEGQRKKTAFAACTKGDFFKVCKGIADKNVDMTLAFVDALCIVYTMAEGCRATHHAGYLHRDIKRENYLLMVLAINNHMISIAQLTDFETAIPEEKADSGRGVGTTDCYPPEHVYFEKVHETHEEALEELTSFRKYVSSENYKDNTIANVFCHHIFHTVLNGDIEGYVKWRTEPMDEKNLQEEQKLYEHLISPEIYMSMRKSLTDQDKARKDARKFRKMDIEKYKIKFVNLYEKFVKYETECKKSRGSYISYRLGEEFDLNPPEVFAVISRHWLPILAAEKTSKSTDLWSLYLDISDFLKFFRYYTPLSQLEKLHIDKIINRSADNMKEFGNRQSAADFMKFLHQEVFIPLLEMPPSQSVVGVERIRALLDMDPKIPKKKVASHINLSFISSLVKNSSISNLQYSLS